MIPNPLVLLKVSDMISGGSSTNYFQIPPEYIAGGGSGNASICTPGTVQVSNSGKSKFYDAGDSKNPPSCATFALPSAWSSSALTSDTDNSVANLNTQGWDDYINMNGSFPATPNYIGGDEATIRSLFARFVLCDLIGNFDQHYYINKNELVKFFGQDGEYTVGLAFKNGNPQYPDDTYLYHPYSTAANLGNGFVGPGYILGNVGVVNNSAYKFQNFMQKTGGYGMLACVLLIFVYMYYQWHTNNKKDNNTKK
jgi:hypothetical protein